MSNFFPYGEFSVPGSAAAAATHWLPTLEAPSYRGASASTADSGDTWRHHAQLLQCSRPTHHGCRKGDAVETEAPGSPHSQHSNSALPSPACAQPIPVPTPAHTKKVTSGSKPPAGVPMTSPQGGLSRTSTLLAADKAAPPRRAKASQGCDPSWPFAIAKVHFFAPCAHHAHLQKNECHFYCVGCTPSTNQPMCQHCLPEHAMACSGSCFQVYRYMYNDVIRTADFGRLHALGDIQAYRANGNCAVHLRPRDMPKTKSPAGFTGRCGGCARHLSPEWAYCSLACKLGIEGYGGGGGSGGGVGRAEEPAATRTASQRGEPRLLSASDDDDDESHGHGHNHGRATSGAAPRARGVKRAPGAAAAAAPTGAKRRKQASPQRSASE